MRRRDSAATSSEAGPVEAVQCSSAGNRQFSTYNPTFSSLLSSSLRKPLLIELPTKRVLILSGHTWKHRTTGLDKALTKRNDEKGKRKRMTESNHDAPLSLTTWPDLLRVQTLFTSSTSALAWPLAFPKAIAPNGRARQLLLPPSIAYSSWIGKSHLAAAAVALSLSLPLDFVCSQCVGSSGPSTVPNVKH